MIQSHIMKKNQSHNTVSYNWGQNIISKLHQVSSSDQTAADLIKKYASQNLIRLKETFSIMYELPKVKEKQTIIELAVIFAYTSDHQTCVDQCFQAIPLILKYSQHPSIHVENALKIFYEFTWDVGIINTTVKHISPLLVIKHFLEFKYTWDVVSPQGNTLAHFAIYHDDKTLLSNALLHNKSWVNVKNIDYAEDLAYTATRYNRFELLKMLIEEHEADINSINVAEINLLANSAYFGRTEIVKYLLDNGCSINGFSNFVFDKKSLASLPYLVDSGYFFAEYHRAYINYDIVRSYINISPEEFINPFFRIVSKDNAHESKLITTIDSLKSCTIEPSAHQIERLRKSLEESMIYANKYDLTAFHDAFNEKFSIDKALYNAKNHNHFELKKYTLRVFPIHKIIKEAAFNYNTPEFLDMLENFLLQILQPDSINELTPVEIEALIPKFSAAFNEAFATEPSPMKSEEFSSLLYKTCYKFITKLLPMIFHKTSKSYLLKQSNEIIDIFSIGINYIILNRGKSGNNLMRSMGFIMDKIKEYRIDNNMSHYIQVLYHVINSYFQVEQDFIEELNESINSIIEERNSIKLTENDRSFDTNIIVAFEYFLNRLYVHPHYIHFQVRIVNQINGFIETHQPSETFNIKAVVDIIQEIKADIYNTYFNLIYQLGNEVFKYEYSPNNQSLHITFHPEYDLKKIKKVIGSLPLLHLEQHKYKLNFFGMPYDQLTNVIKFLNEISEKSIEPTLERSDCDSPTLASADPSSDKNYHISLPTFSTSKPLMFKKAICTQSGESSAMGADTKHPYQDKALLHHIQSELRDKLSLPAHAEIYHMVHPRYPDARKHLCWGIWIPSTMDKRAASITDEVLERHRQLLKDQAPLDIPAKDVSGFKIVSFMNLDTGKIEYSYKTKIPNRSERIVAVPYQIVLKSSEQANVYCFGFIDADHAKEMLKISPRQFLDTVKSQPASTLTL